MADNTQSGHNLAALKEEIAAGVASMEQAKLRRKQANDDIAAVRSTLESKGIPKKALAMALAYQSLDPDDRQGFDVAYDIVREAVGLPVQENFDAWVARTAAKKGNEPAKMN